LIHFHINDHRSTSITTTTTTTTTTASSSQSGGSSFTVPYQQQRYESIGELKHEPQQQLEQEQHQLKQQQQQPTQFDKRCDYAKYPTLDDFLKSNCHLVFPTTSTTKTMDVSIVVSLNNEPQDSYKLLQSLLVLNTTSSGVQYEVIFLVDNESNTAVMQTREMLIRTQNAKIFINIGTAMNKKLSHSKAVNYVVKQLASNKSRFYWLINDDVKVSPRSLDVLYSDIESDSSVGAVGCKLLSSTGRLKAAGSIVFQDGTTMSYGTDNNANDIEFNYRRSVDFVSDACLMVRKDALLSVGGLSEELSDYSHTEFEAIDLQMAIRYRKKLEVIYQPFAVATYLRSGSDSSSSEQLAASRKKLYDRWFRVLQERRYPVGKNIECSREIVESGLRVLWIDQEVRPPSFGSGFGRALELCSVIRSLGHSITMFPYERRRTFEGEDEYRRVNGIELFTSSAPLNVNQLDRRLREFLLKRRGFYDVVIVSRPNIFVKVYDIVRTSFPGVPIIYDAEGVWFVRDWIRHKKYHSLFDRHKMDDEFGIFKKANETWFVSQRDNNIIRRLLNSEINYSIISHAIEIVPTRASRKERNGVGFLGAFHNFLYYNGDAVTYPPE